MQAPPYQEEIIHPPSDRKALEWITALAAEGLAYRLTREAMDWRLVVPAKQGEQAWAAIMAYEKANIGWPPGRTRPTEPPSLAHPLWSGLLGGGFIAMVFICFGPYVAANPWLRAAAADSTGFAAGQWWRPITALTLHTTFSHLAGNVLFLAILGGLVCRSLGVGLGWVLILASGITGNILAASVAQAPYIAVGASTSCFGALGMLALYQAAENYRRYGHWKSVWSRVWIPLCAGLAMLGLYGTAPHSDVVAHGCGFLCGMVVVAPFAVRGTRRLPEIIDAVLKLTTVVTIMIAWRAAIRFAS